MSYRFLFVEDKHPAKPGTVTVAGEPNLDVPPGTLNSILKQAGLKGQQDTFRNSTRKSCRTRRSGRGQKTGASRGAWRCAPCRVGGVMWNGIPYGTAVIPAKAGIQSLDSAFPKVWGVDSRPSESSGQAFRGNDCDMHRPRLANDTCTAARYLWQEC